MTTTHYDRVGVPLAATTAEIKRAYRRRARHAHPDHGGSATQFRLLTDAYELLVDAERRAAYDAELERSFSAPTTPEPERPTPPRADPPPEGGRTKTSTPPKASGPRPGPTPPRLPPRVVLDEPRVPERPSTAVRRARAAAWVAAGLLVAYVAATYVLTVAWPAAPAYDAFVLVAGPPVFVGLCTLRRPRTSGPHRSSSGWLVLWLLLSAALTAFYVAAAHRGDPPGLEPSIMWAFAASTGLVPALLVLAGHVLRAARARELRALVAEHVRWASATERRARAEEWVTLETAARRPGHRLWWVLDAAHDGARTQVRVTNLDRTRSRTGSVQGPCFAHVWIVIDEQTEAIVARCSDDRRQAWLHELAEARQV